MEEKNLVSQVILVAEAAGKLVLSIEKPRVTSKEGHANYVTEADVSSQRYCIGQLTPLVEGAHFFAEEQEENCLAPGYNWVIDPIDGTTNFMRGYRHSAISIGLVKDGEAVLGVVHNPYTGETFSAVKGEGAFLNHTAIQVEETPIADSLIVFGTSPYYREKADETFRIVKEIFLNCGDVRRSGSAALDLCYVAAGRCDGFFESLLSPWDYAAAAIILAEAGGKIGTAGNRPVTFEKKQPILAGSPRIFDFLQEQMP